jgi:hypothetical protein
MRIRRCEYRIMEVTCNDLNWLCVWPTGSVLWQWYYTIRVHNSVLGCSVKNLRHSLRVNDGRLTDGPVDFLFRNEVMTSTAVRT